MPLYFYIEMTAYAAYVNANKISCEAESGGWNTGVCVCVCPSPHIQILAQSIDKCSVESWFDVKWQSHEMLNQCIYSHFFGTLKEHWQHAGY